MRSSLKARSDAVGAAVSFQVANRAESLKFIDQLRKHGYATLDLTDDEMAKLHVRHLVGGHAPQADHELLYRFEFPERPGALMNSSIA